MLMRQSIISNICKATAKIQIFHRDLIYFKLWMLLLSIDGMQKDIYKINVEN